MKFKKIVGFGDSWMWGDELIDPTGAADLCTGDFANIPYREKNCFLGLLGQHYNIPTQNFGIPGGSVHSSISTYLWWIKNEKLPIEDCLVLVGIPAPVRVSFIDPNHKDLPGNPPWNKFVHSSWIHSGSKAYSQEWIDTIKSLTNLTHCDELLQLNIDLVVYFFEGQSKIFNNNLIQFKSNQSVVNCTNDRFKSYIWPDQSLDDLIKQTKNSNDLLAPNGHPNKKGHELIAKHLIDYIDSCIIKQ